MFELLNLNLNQNLHKHNNKIQLLLTIIIKICYCHQTALQFLFVISVFSQNIYHQKPHVQYNKPIIKYL